jgi:antitoxin component YwqK of YwqJK toxin-antitoxin module
MKHYRSSIPKAARERVTATFVSGPQKYKAEYMLNGNVVGIRYFHETGELSNEYPLRNGLTHGIVYRSDKPGKLLSAEPYFSGLPHGTAKQWSDEGKLLGMYTMNHGTGVDLWWQRSPNRAPYLAEARYLQEGKWHGFEWWWFSENRRALGVERHFWNNKVHGIERSWNQHGRLRRGYPKYWVSDERVSKRQYIRACAKDPTLPPFRERDNLRKRKFLPEIKGHMG